MSEPVPVTRLTGVGDTTRFRLEEHGVTNIRELLSERIELSKFINRAWRYEAGIDLLRTYVPPPSIDVSDEEMAQLLKIYLATNGTAKTIDGTAVPDPFDRNSTRISCVYDAANTLVVERGAGTVTADTIDDTFDPSLVIDIPDTGRQLVTTASDVATIQDAQFAVFNQSKLDVVLAAMDTTLETAIQHAVFDHQSPIVFDVPGGLSAAVAPVRISDIAGPAVVDENSPIVADL